MGAPPKKLERTSATLDTFCAHTTGTNKYSRKQDINWSIEEEKDMQVCIQLDTNSDSVYSNHQRREEQLWQQGNGTKKAESGKPITACLTTDQIAKCARADEGDLFPSPVPTRMISNGEYMPALQTEKQAQVEARIAELAESASRKLAIDRRRFLAGSGGMAAAFVAMNEVFGRFFDVDLVEMFEPAAYAQSGAPRDLFVFDDQLHMVRGSQRAGGAGLRALARAHRRRPRSRRIRLIRKDLPDERGEVWGVWNPALVGLPINAQRADRPLH